MTYISLTMIRSTYDDQHVIFLKGFQMNTDQIEQDKRQWLIATSIAGGIGVAAFAIPLVSTFAHQKEQKQRVLQWRLKLAI